MSEFREVIHLRDPAIDWARVAEQQGTEGRGLYLQHVQERDPALIEQFTVDGQLPTYYRLREIPHDLEDWIVEMNSPETGGATSRTYARALCASLVLVRNRKTREGSIIAEWEPPSHKSGPLKGLVREDAIKEIDIRVRIDVGALAYQVMGPHWTTWPTLVLPLTFLDLLGPPRRRSADAT